MRRGPGNDKIHSIVLEPVDLREPRAMDACDGARGHGRGSHAERGSDDGEYTRLTRFRPGADTTPFGGKSHTYPEEVFIVSGRLYDHAFDLWLEAGHYASRPAGELHGPFRTDVGCVVLELSFPSRVTE